MVWKTFGAGVPVGSGKQLDVMIRYRDFSTVSRKLLWTVFPLDGSRRSRKVNDIERSTWLLAQLQRN